MGFSSPSPDGGEKNLALHLGRNFCKRQSIPVMIGKGPYLERFEMLLYRENRTDLQLSSSILGSDTHKINRSVFVEAVDPEVDFMSVGAQDTGAELQIDRKSTRLNSSHVRISYA